MALTSLQAVLTAIDKLIEDIQKATVTDPADERRRTRVIMVLHAVRSVLVATCLEVNPTSDYWSFQFNKSGH